jgi:hypothetical protein
MKLAYFPKHCALNSHEPMQAFLSSCRNNGIELAENSLDADAAVIWSVTWAGRLQGNESVYQTYRQTGRPVIVLEVGALHRGYTWKIAVNNITANGFYGHRDNLDWDRPAKLKLPKASTAPPCPSILIAAQHSRSLQVEQLASVDQWIQNTVREIKTHTDRPIVLRPHPRSRVDAELLPADVVVQTPLKIPGTHDNFDIDYQHHAVINYNSGAGVQAALAGAVVIVDPTSLAYPVSNSITTIEQPVDIDQTLWRVEIAHTEYLTDEIERGLWIPRLAPQLPL